VVFKRFGINVKFVESSDPAEYAKAIDDKTKAIYVETIGNPKYNVSPIPELSKVNAFDPVLNLVHHFLSLGCS